MKTINSLLLAFAFAGSTYAQSTQVAKPAVAKKQKISVEQRQDNRLEKMKTELGLTDAQSTQIKTIIDKRAAEIQSLKKQLRDLKMAERKEIGAVLTEEQKEKLKSMHQEHKEME